MDTNGYNRRSFFRNAGLLGLAGIVGSKATDVLAAESVATPAAAAGSTVTLPFEHGERLVVQCP